MAILNNNRALTAGAFMASVSLGSLLADSSLAQDQLSFTRQDTSLGAFAGPNDAATADFNGDGEVDLVLTTDIPTLRILLGNGDGTFQAAPTPPIQQQVGSVTVADLNDDGRQDLAMASFASNAVVIRLGNGDGTFQAAPDITTDSGGPGSIAAGDFNGDDAQDLAVSTFSNGERSVSIYLGAGDGTFSRGQEIADGNPFAVTAGDFNGDGRPDLAAIDFIFEHNRVLILLGQGDGTFEPVAQTSDVGPEASSLTLGDFNGDGRQDVATADGNNDVVSVLIGNGDGTFAAAQNLAPAPPAPGVLVQPLAIAVGDFNGDGHPDLATANRRPSDPPVDGSASVLLGRGDGSFEPAQEFATTEGTQVLSVADFNGDGLIDIATFGDSERDQDAMTVLLNTTAVAETQVTIDIKPASSGNRINPRSNGKIRVAILTSDSFDATEVDPTTVRFGRTGTEAAPVHFDLKDVDRDGNTDIVLRFMTRQTGIACGDTSASLSGRTFGGQVISGSDSIRTVGCRQP